MLSLCARASRAVAIGPRPNSRILPRLVTRTRHYAAISTTHDSTWHEAIESPPCPPFPRYAGPFVMGADEPGTALNVRQNDFALASVTLRQAVEVAVKVKDPMHGAHVLGLIAVSQATVEDLPSALKTAAKTGDPKRTVLAMADIASIQAKRGRESDSQRFFGRRTSWPRRVINSGSG